MNKQIGSLPALERPTRVRMSVLVFACTLSMISYLDRVCISKALPDIQAALGLNSVADLKWAITAFAFAYAAFEIPSGWLGDVFGPRNVMIRIVLWWSFFTALTGMVGLSMAGLFFGLPMLVAVRFLFGMGEAGTYPNITRALHNWFPFGERGSAQGTVWMAGRLMGGLTPMFWLVLIEGLHLQWRQLFWVFGAIGVGWCVLFYVFFRNRPEENPKVNDAELLLIREGRHEGEDGHASIPWGRLLTDLNLWALCLMYFCGSFGWYFNITYLATYLDRQLGIGPNDSLVALLHTLTGKEPDQLQGVVMAVYQGGPLWMGALACLVGGFLTDRFIRKTGNRKWGRRLFGVVGHGLCAACYFFCLHASTAFTFFLAISLAAFFNDLTMGAAWAACQDIGKRYAAIVAGCMNTVGNLGGAAAGWVTGVVLDHYLQVHAVSQGIAVEDLSPAQKVIGLQGGYQMSFILFALVYVIAVGFWLYVDSTRAVTDVE